MRRAPLAVALGLALFGAAVSVAEAEDQVFDTAVLQGLDKVTGRIQKIEAPVGATIHFGTLEIIARTCRKRPPEEQPEAASFLDIWEIKPNEPATSLFRGWMFASSPALSALEHPVYDIWVLDCVDTNSKGSTGNSP